MSGHTIMLPDLMVLLPDLHPGTLVRNQVATLKELRQVSKEIGVLASLAITSCEVHLGQGAGAPFPEHLVKLLAGTQLKKFKVIVTVMSGPTSPTVSRQLSTCMRQMECLLGGLSKAMQSITTLTLAVAHIENKHLLPHSNPNECADRAKQQLPCCEDAAATAAAAGLAAAAVAAVGAPSESAGSASAGSAAIAATATGHSNPPSATATSEPVPSFSEILNSCPDGLGVVGGSVFAMLAPAVPHLRELWLEGCCWDAALYAFGDSCPLLTTLDVQAPHVPIQAVQNMGRHLPNLATVRFGSEPICNGYDIQLYVDEFLTACGGCPKLASLSIQFDSVVTLDCCPKAWAGLSASLSHLQVECLMTDSYEYQRLIRRVPSLCLEAYPCEGLLQLLKRFPVLQSLVVLDTDFYDGSFRLEFNYYDEDEVGRDERSGRSLLKQRFLDKSFLLECSLNLVGTNAEIRDMFKLMPQLPLVGRVAVQHSSEGGATCDWLAQLPRVFPNLRWLTIYGEGVPLDVGGIDTGLCKTLAALSQLYSLHLDKEMPLSTNELVQLCSSLPKLGSLEYIGCAGVDRDDLEGQLKAQGRRIRITQVGRNDPLM